MNTVISVNNLSKKYVIGHQRSERYTALRDVIANSIKGVFKKGESLNETQEEFWALKDVSFDVQQGERIGIIGKNGAGKSTLLKLLSRITEPTTGRIAIKGRVSSLLEVGTGFHPELTGRENIFLNGAVLGMSKADIKKRFDEIVAFAEVEKFLDTPVKRYSSGMYVRLAFAVAAHLEPDILIVDEVLAVGDAAFQKKCLGKMERASQDGRTVLFVSHNLKAVTLLCSRAILLEEGSITADGTAIDTVDAYTSRLKEHLDQKQARQVFERADGKSAQITEIRMLKKNGGLSARFGVMEPMTLEVDFTLTNDFPTLILFLQIWGSDSTLVSCSQDSDYQNFLGKNMQDYFPRKKGRYTARIELPNPVLNSGIYELEFVISTGPVRIDTQRNIFFEVAEEGSFLTHVSKSPRGGLLAVPVPWEVSCKEKETSCF